MNRKEVFSDINDRILERLKQGIVPWKKSWTSGVPRNFITKKPYHGLNFLSLAMQDFPSPYYLSFLQCKQKQGSIIKGSSGNIILYWDIKELSKEVDGEVETKKIPFMKWSYIFNLAQTTLYEDTSDENLIVECEDLIRRIEPKPVIRHNTMRCYYTPDEDYISLPKISDFDNDGEYYSALFHELIHWTGHPKRLNRFTSAMPDKQEYSFEELVAEIGSAYLCAMCGISPKVIDNQAAYLQGWMNLAFEEENLFVKATLKAQEAVNYLIER